MKSRDRIRGALIGLAVGDAVGGAVEFKTPGTFEPISDMIGGGIWELAPGEWTDDTSMALCLAESLIQTRGFDPDDQISRYVQWWREGHLSSKGVCFDIGPTTRAALERYLRDGNPIAGSTDPMTSGNGSLMRLAPIPMFFADDNAMAIAMAGESSRVTHASRIAVDACRYFAGLLIGAFQGVSKHELLGERYSPLGGWSEGDLAPEVDEVAAGSFHRKQPPEIEAAVYVVRTLEAALWAFQHTDDFTNGCLEAANLGDDSDTCAAIYGQIAGAFYGESEIPVGWRQRIALPEVLNEFADGLYFRSPMDVVRKRLDNAYQDAQMLIAQHGSAKQAIAAYTADSQRHDPMNTPVGFPGQEAAMLRALALEAITERN